MLFYFSSPIKPKVCNQHGVQKIHTATENCPMILRILQTPLPAFQIGSYRMVKIIKFCIPEMTSTARLNLIIAVSIPDIAICIACIAGYHLQMQLQCNANANATSKSDTFQQLPSLPRIFAVELCYQSVQFLVRHLQNKTWVIIITLSSCIFAVRPMLTLIM